MNKATFDELFESAKTLGKMLYEFNEQKSMDKNFDADFRRRVKEKYFYTPAEDLTVEDMDGFSKLVFDMYGDHDHKDEECNCYEEF